MVKRIKTHKISHFLLSHKQNTLARLYQSVKCISNSYKACNVKMWDIRRDTD